jgi:hypothetical protein
MPRSPIDAALARPLSGTEVSERIGGPVYRYKQLAGMAELPPRPFGLLYEDQEKSGHWTAVLDTRDANGRPCVEHFDSYGEAPDRQRDFIPREYLEASGQGRPFLARLLLPFNNVAYSSQRLQHLRPGISTCGRWCVARAACSYQCAEEFADVIKRTAKSNRTSLDRLVCRLVPVPPEADNHYL